MEVEQPSPPSSQPPPQLPPTQIGEQADVAVSRSSEGVVGGVQEEQEQTEHSVHNNVPNGMAPTASVNPLGT